MMYVAIALFVAAWVLLYLMRRDTIARGVQEAKLKSINDMLEDNARVKSARNSLAANPNGATASKLRDKYTRK